MIRTKLRLLLLLLMLDFQEKVMKILLEKSVKTQDVDGVLNERRELIEQTEKLNEQN